LISFNRPAFQSYGNVQGQNAPVSEVAAFAYSAALERMVGRDSRNRIPGTLADATVIYWADASGIDDVAARAAEEIFAGLFASDSTKSVADLDAQETARLGAQLRFLAKGCPIKDLDPRLEPGTRFCVLGLAPNAGRISVRFWLEDDFQPIARHLALHAHDLAIEPRPSGWISPPSVRALLFKTIAVERKRGSIPPQLAGEVMRSILTGVPYPQPLLARVLSRVRARKDFRTGWHAALLKACINRALRFSSLNGPRFVMSAPGNQFTRAELPMALDPDHPNVAYQLGRLFALLEDAQYAALGRVNTSIGDSYYAAASTTPARVFGTLLRGCKYHVLAAKRRGKGGWIDRKVAEIVQTLPAQLPTALRLDDQGRFAVGYYHQRAMRAVKNNHIEVSEEENGEE
jgi:CRISPR-associated protein Csd1